MPFGIHITNGNTITTHYKNKEFTYIFIDKDPLEVFQTIQNVLISDFGVFSKKDIKKSKNTLSNDLSTIEENREDNWKKIRRSSVQNFLLHKYALNYAKKLNRDIDFARYVKNTVNVLINTKEIASDDIVMKSGKIKSINNLIYDPKTDTLHVKNYKKQKAKKDQKTYMSDNWIKMLNNIS